MYSHWPAIPPWKLFSCHGVGLNLLASFHIDIFLCSLVYFIYSEETGDLFTRTEKTLEKKKISTKWAKILLGKAKPVDIKPCRVLLVMQKKKNEAHNHQ